jgi:hypothetical protein
LKAGALLERKLERFSQSGGILEFAHSVWSGKRLLSSSGPAIEAQGCSCQNAARSTDQASPEDHPLQTNWQARLKEERNEWEAKPFNFQLGA